MEPLHIKQEPNRDMYNNFEPNHEYDFKPIVFKSEEGSKYGFFNEPIKCQLYNDNYNEKNIVTDNFLNTILKQDPEPEPDLITKDFQESEEEDFELKLSDTSGEDDVRNESIPDLRAVTDKLKDTNINETPSNSNAKRKRAPAKVNKVVRETPARKKTMKQTSLLSFFNVKESSSVETNKKSRTRKSTQVKSATVTIDPVEMIKIKSVRVILERLPATKPSNPQTNVQGTTKLIHRHCAKCNKYYPYLGITSNSRCVQCSGAIAFRCGQCSKIYRSHSGVRYHLEAQCMLGREFKEFRCSQCNYVSAVKQLLHKHEKSMHKRKDVGRISCEKCQMGFDNENNLKRHQRLQCPKKNELRCNDCDFKTNSLIQFKGHQAIHKTGRTITKSTAEDSLMQPYCRACESSMSKSRYAKKCYKCKMTLSFQCTTCHLTFATKKEVQNHAKIHTSQNIKKHKKDLNK